MDDKIHQPPSEIIESFLHFLKSLKFTSKQTIIEKANDIKTLLINENSIHWFSFELLTTKIVNEIQNHNFYDDFLKNIDNKILNSFVIKDTIFS